MMQGCWIWMEKWRCLATPTGKKLGGAKSSLTTTPTPQPFTFFFDISNGLVTD
jgi:hypothetical protein